MVALFERLREDSPQSHLDLIGDKVHNPSDDPGFKLTAERTLRETQNLVWHGGLSRSETQELLRAADVALSIRDPAMVHSRELSTKVLEYGAAGCAVVLNRTPLYEQLLGADYPLFVRQPGEALDLLHRMGEEPALRLAAAERCERASREFVYQRVAARLAPYVPRPAQGMPGEAHRLTIAGHDLKFARQLRSSLSGLAEIQEDRWEGHTQHSAARSRKLSSWADVVLCEWCLGNAVWYSRNGRPDQRLVIRFHRVELETGYPAEVEQEQVDVWVFVAEHVFEQAASRFSLPAQKRVVIPNVIDVGRFARPKLPGATFNLGMIGFVPSLKRVDRALDILEALRAGDPRFRLILKGNPPWEYPWVKRRETERRFYQQVYRRIARSPLLRDAVSFDSFGPNVPAFLQKVRFLLSTSEVEGDQVAVAEAAAAAAIPVVLERPGAADQYPPEWVHASPKLAAAAVLEVVYEEGAEARGAEAVEFAGKRWSAESVGPRWAEVLGLAPEPALEPARAS
jgi:glycosyltransferase involved in cell wall biosynthesis